MRLFIIFLIMPIFVFSNSQKLLENMSFDEKIGQLFMVPACPTKEKAHLKDLENIIKKYHIGGVIVKQSDPKTQINFLNHLQKISKLPLLVSADAEWGLGMRMDATIAYPKNVYLGTLRDSSLIYDLGKEIARQLKLVGVHINLAPVVDINNNPNTPSISERVFSKDPKKVTHLANLFSKGLQSQNVLATAKHFPGYGDINVDPHLNLPIAYHDLERLDKIELVPYRELIKNEISLIMTAHILLPNISDLPATMSSKLTKDLLRDKLKFKGLIITDALNMKALTNIYNVEDIAYFAHTAGNDILLYGDHIGPNIDDILLRQVPLAFNRIKKAYLDGDLKEEDLDIIVLRIFKAKEKVQLFENRFVEDFDEIALNSEYAYELKEKIENLLK